MIAYNTTWLDNLYIQEEAGKGLREESIGAEEATAIYERYPVGFYSPNLFIRIALFALTVVIALFTLVIFILISGGRWEHESTWQIRAILVGVLAYAALEFLIRNKHIYRAGADDALLWISGAFIVIAFGGIMDLSDPGIALLTFVIALYFSLRFVNAVMSVVATLALLAVVFLLYTKLGAFAKATTPFLLILICALLYAWLTKAGRGTAWRRYTHCITLVTIVVLVCFYAAGNFYAVRETSNEMFHLDLKEGESIPAGWFFWLWTILIPLVYILRGIQKKDPLLLRTGLLLVAVLVFTVRYYYHLLPVEVAMVAGGLLLFGIAWALMRYLKTPKHGFTALAAKDPHFMDKLNVESLVIAETFRPAAPVATDPGTSFGGGTGSGGGASGGY